MLLDPSKPDITLMYFSCAVGGGGSCDPQDLPPPPPLDPALDLAKYILLCITNILLPCTLLKAYTITTFIMALRGFTKYHSFIVGSSLSLEAVSPLHHYPQSSRKTGAGGQSHWTIQLHCVDKKWACSRYKWLSCQ